MAKERIYELAKELKMPSKDLVDMAKKEGITVKSHMSSVTSEEANRLRSMAKGTNKPAAAKASQPKQEQPKRPEHNSRPQNGQQSQNNNRHSNNNRGGNDDNGRGVHVFNKNKNNKKNRRNKNNKHNKNQRMREVKKQQPTQRKDRPLPDVLEYTEGMNAQDLAKLLHRPAAEIIKKLFMLGVMVNQNQSLDTDTIELLAADYGIEAKEKVQEDIADLDKFFDQENQNTEHMVSRPPVVTVMGHVDHGKTSILDRIRNAHVTAGEAGGITQHIGAYQVRYEGKDITFLDTPGHEAFTAMRARGANITDIAILVVAADDGIMPQTVESINHAKAAGITVIVAINKMDKEGANPDRIKEELTKYGMVCEEWGGDVICVPVSAKTGEGIDDLLENILLVAETSELKANPDRRAKGTVVEARLDKGRGPIATLLVQNGTLHVGDVIIAGTAVGRVRVMTNDKGQAVESAGPSVPVEITGLAEVPEAGDTFNAVEDERLARELVEQRKHEAKQAKFNEYQKVTLDNLFSQIEQGEMKELSLIVKADVQGSVEAVTQSLEKLSNEEVRVRVIHGGVGGIKESDVMLASASNAIIIGFNVRPDQTAEEIAARDKVDIRTYRVIYDAIEEIETAMKGMLAPKFREVVMGRIEVRQVYKISNVGAVAGAYVLNGKVTRQCEIRVVRDGIVIAEDKMSSLKRFKDDVKEVGESYECGITLEKFRDFKEGDIFEAFIMEEYRD